MSAISMALAAELPASNPTLLVLRRLASGWQGLVALVILAIVVALAMLAPWIAPFSPTRISFTLVITPPSRLHWFGTDEAGRDILSRVIFGARTSMEIVTVAVAIGGIAGTVIGLWAGWRGGILDTLLMRALDAVLSFPTLVLALAIIAVLGPDLVNAILALAVVQVPAFARVVRSEVLAMRELDYVKAMRAMGAGDLRIVTRHIWPNAAGPVIVYVSTSASLALMAEASLSFLGLGVQPPTPSWGSMISVGMQNYQAWWMSIFPGLAIFFTVFAFNLLGNALRDALDVRLDR